jgi:hypothetical protein
MIIASYAEIMQNQISNHISPTFKHILTLVASGDVKISIHGYDDTSNSDIPIDDLVSRISSAIVLEDYPLFPKGPCVLVLQHDHHGQPIHVVWGTPKDHPGPAVLITAYRPDDTRWDEGFTRRKR